MIKSEKKNKICIKDGKNYVRKLSAENNCIECYKLQHYKVKDIEKASPEDW